MEPTSRAEFLQYCLGRLGAGGSVTNPFSGVINIEMTTFQADNCIDDALTMWRQYHYDGTYRTYYKQLITQDILNQMWVPCPDNIMTVNRVLEIDTDNLSIFDIRYQLRLQDFYNFSNVSMQHYVITLEKLRLIDWLMNPEPTISFNRLSNRIYLNADWQYRIILGDYLIFEVYEWLDENQFNRIWADIWLRNYTTALLRRQWGANVKKYKGVATLGGIVLDGQTIYDEAKDEIEKLEEQLHADYQIPPRIFIG
jgi:hypothetical protein